jgi:peptide subunit release factor 1 (eRF1)
LVRTGQSGSGFRCVASGRLALAKTDCRGEGEPAPVPDLISEIIEEALRQHLEIVMIDDPEAAERIDGIAGLLRFR